MFLAAALYANVLSDVNKLIRKIIQVFLDHGMEENGLSPSFRSIDFNILQISEKEFKKSLPTIFDFITKHIGDPLDPTLKV